MHFIRQSKAQFWHYCKSLFSFCFLPEKITASNLGCLSVQSIVFSSWTLRSRSAFEFFQSEDLTCSNHIFKVDLCGTKRASNKITKFLKIVVVACLAEAQRESFHTTLQPFKSFRRMRRHIEIQQFKLANRSRKKIRLRYPAVLHRLGLGCEAKKDCQ